MQGRIDINGQIGSYGDEKGVELIDVITQVRKQPEATSFRVYINSEGGLVDTGFDIYNYLRSLGLPITTIGNGLVASIATVIFMAGDKRLVRENTMFMIHLPMGGARGTAEEIAEYGKSIKKVEKRVMKFYQDNFQLNEEAIKPLLKNETWLTEEQLSDLGIITSEAIHVAAKAEITPKIDEMKNTGKKTTDAEVILEKFKAILNGATVENKKVLLNADMKEVVFPDLKKDEEIKVDDVATVDGQPAKEEIVLQDGRILTFGEHGKVKAIKEAEEKKDEAVDAADLAAIQAELAQLKTDKAALETEKATLTAELATAKAKITSQDAVLNALKNVETDAVVNTGGRTNKKDNEEQPSRFQNAFSKLKK